MKPNNTMTGSNFISWLVMMYDYTNTYNQGSTRDRCMWQGILLT